MWQFLVLIILFFTPCFAQKPKFVFEEPDRINLLTFSNDGKMLAAVTSQGCKVYNTESGKLKGKSETTWYSNSVIFSSDGKRLITGHNDGKVRLWDTSTFSELKTLSVTKWSIYNLAISPDDKILAIDAGDGTVELWNIQNGKKFGTLGNAGQRMKSMSFTHNGNFLATINLDSELTLWNIKAQEKAFSVKESSDSPLTFSPMDLELIVTHLNSIDFLDVKDGKVSHTVKIPKENIPCTAQVMQVNCHGKVVISNDNKTIVINNWKTKIITLLDIKTGKVKNNFDDAVSTHSSFICVLSPDGKYVASGSTDGKVKVWQVE